ncbi:MAG: hypothetical protein FJ290_11710 [Planctomycetes bacterium]|nr:hypothetical protein [Planctomycetota bacterium]
MPIKFACECGKILTAPDGTEGKRARCSACKRAVTIPSGFHLSNAEDATPPPGATGGAAGGEACPSCGRPLAAEAVLCVHCGFDRRTGLQVGFGPQPRGGKRGVAFTFPVVKVAIGAGVLAVLAAAWFFVVSPLLGKMHLTNAVGYVTNGDLRKAETAFKELQPKLSGPDRERADLWLKQIPLELEKNRGKILDQGNEVKSDTVDMVLGKPVVMPGAIEAKVKITNRGLTPLTLRNTYFYLRGIRDIVLVAVHDDNTLGSEGAVVKPKETWEGIVVFRKAPDHQVQKGKGGSGLDSMGASYFYLIYNDGTNYTKRMLQF